MELLDQNILESREKRVVILNQDSFYRDLDQEQREEAANGEYNFDHPGLCSCLLGCLLHTFINYYPHLY